MGKLDLWSRSSHWPQPNKIQVNYITTKLTKLTKIKIILSVYKENKPSAVNYFGRQMWPVKHKGRQRYAYSPS